MAFWVFLAGVCVYGLLNWTKKQGPLGAGVITSMCLALLVVILLELKRNGESQLSFLKMEVAFTKDAIFGNQPCIFCKSYWRYLKKQSLLKRKEWENYFSKLQRWYAQSFK